MKYIDAEKLIAEIERLKKKFSNYKAKNETEKCYKGGRLIGYEDALYKIAFLQQKQPDLPSGEEVMTTCNQILIDWVKEGKTQEEKESRKEAHSRFFELYDGYLMQEQPEMDLDEEITRFWKKEKESGQYTDTSFDAFVTLQHIAYHFANWQKEQDGKIKN